MTRALPIVRADFVLVERYRVESHAQVSCPITVFAGIADPGASPAEAAAWALRTTAAYRMVELEAGHFFLNSHRDALLAEIRAELAPRLA